MFGSFFSWIRERSCNAVLAGLADAAEKLNGNQAQDDTMERIAGLRLILALPAPEEASPKTRRKAE